MPQGLTSTRADAGQALQAGGRAVTAAHEQIAAVLRARLGQNHAELLATPKPLPDGGIAWSTLLAGELRPAAQLAPEERTRLQQRAERFESEIRALAQQLRSEGPASAVVAGLLEQALQAPPGEWLYSVGGRPVRVMWGHAAPGTVIAAPAVLAPATVAPTPVAAAQAAPAAAAAPAAPAAPASRWWLWLLLALGLAYLAFFAWKRFGATPVVAGNDLADRIAQAQARNQTLEEEIAARRNARPQRACVVDPPAPAPVASAPEPPPVASAPPAPPPPPPPPASRPEPPRWTAGEPSKDRKAVKALRIPPGALERGDLSFLEGVWQLGEPRMSIYQGSPDNEVGHRRILLEFDRRGGGRFNGVEQQRHGRAVPDCQGSLRARTDGKKLYMELGDCRVPGRPDLEVDGSKHVCQLEKDGTTMCYGVNDDGVKWDAPLRRLQ